MAATPALRFRLSADTIRDVCARPAVLAALTAAVPTGAVRGEADRRQAAADGVARALELALRGDGRDGALIAEAEQRMWDPVPADLARLLSRVGPDGLFAYWVVDGAVRREAWRAHAQRRRRDRPGPLTDDVPSSPERDPIDLRRFRLEVERAVDATVERTGLPEHLVYGVVAHDVTYVEAGRRSGRSPNGIWMALARLRPEWRGVAERGREAGLGGGILVNTADHVDRAARRVVRWKLVGGVLATVLLAGTLGAILLAAHIEGTPPPPREPVHEREGDTARRARLAALSAVRLQAPAPVRRQRARSAPVRTRAVPASPAPAPVDSCGLGTAALTCR